MCAQLLLDDSEFTSRHMSMSSETTGMLSGCLAGRLERLMIVQHSKHHQTS